MIQNSQERKTTGQLSGDLVRAQLHPQFTCGLESSRLCVLVYSQRRGPSSVLQLAPRVIVEPTWDPICKPESTVQTS